MELINITVSNWGINIQSYLIDLFLPYRTFTIVILIVIALRIRKILKDKKRKS